MNSKFYILREFAENKVVDRERICHTYNITYSEFDDYIDELTVCDKYLSKIENDKCDYPYEVSKIGYEYLDKYRVELAVILAAGLGTRMGDKTKDDSKCLLTVKGEILIERLISQLRERGIKDIVVVIGHVKEKFYYLKDKYNVKLIENPEYNTKNTIASFHTAVEDMKNKNTYITVGDIYLEYNMFHTYEAEPFYAGPWTEDCTNEWVYLYDYDCKVQGVKVDGTFDYTIGGFSFHTKDFINRLIELAEDDYKRAGTEKYYWEDVLVNNIKILPDFYVHKIPSGVLKEFDTVKDLERLNDEIIVLKEKVRKIFNQTNDNFTITKLTAGLTNNSYLLTIKDEKYLIRVAGASTGLLIDRKNEKRNYDVLAKYNLTDEVVYFDEESGMKISKYIDGAKVIDLKNVEDIKESMKLYKKLHSLDIDTGHKVSIDKVLNSYMDVLDRYKIKFIYGDIDMYLKKCSEIIDFIKRENRPHSFTHGDAGYCNVLKFENNYNLIDFEFAGMADPLTDLALFGICSEMSIEDTLKLIDVYKACEVEDVNNKEFLQRFKLDSDEEKIKSLIVSYMALDILSCLIWHQIRVTITDIYTYNYGENNLKIFDECYKYLKTKNIL